MVDEIATRRNSDDGGATRVAEAADFVWRLATTMGLSSERADDVCFLTLQEAVTTEPESGDAVGHGGLLRAAVDQCAVARCLCAAHPRASAQPPTLQQVLS